MKKFLKNWKRFRSNKQKIVDIEKTENKKQRTILCFLLRLKIFIMRGRPDSNRQPYP